MLDLKKEQDIKSVFWESQKILLNLNKRAKRIRAFLGILKDFVEPVRKEEDILKILPVFATL